MSNSQRVARVVATIFLGALPSCVAPSQLPDVGKEPTRCGFHEVYRKEGWIVPGIQNANTKYRAAFKNVPGVYVIGLLPSQAETTILLVYYSHDHADRLEMENLPIRILDLTAYEANGHVFAYGVSYEKQVIENGVRVRLGAASGVMFYDIDGSGRFTLHKSALWPFIPDSPPSWTAQP